jgi:hypothetical protein
LVDTKYPSRDNLGIDLHVVQQQFQQTGNWNFEAFDIAPMVIAQLLSVNIVILQNGMDPIETNPNFLFQIVLIRDGDHYDGTTPFTGKVPLPIILFLMSIDFMAQQVLNLPEILLIWINYFRDLRICGQKCHLKDKSITIKETWQLSLKRCFEERGLGLNL